jgi:octanoyl-[GcvH]:protein N-octanoyltransferase
MGRPPIRLFLDLPSGGPIFDTAVSHAMLRQVAEGEVRESLRVYRPDDAVLFSLLDARRPGFPRALEIAREAGFGACLRLAGGHAAVFHGDTLAFSWASAAESAHTSIGPRFDQIVAIVLGALRGLGVDARSGEVPGEYCPGDHSVNAGGRTKLMGVGQRVIKGGAHVGGVLVVDRSDRVRDVLVPIYEALELEWRPETVGSVADEVGSISLETVRTALVDAFARIRTIEPSDFSPGLLDRAATLCSFHDPAVSPKKRGAKLGAGKTVAVDDGGGSDGAA